MVQSKRKQVREYLAKLEEMRAANRAKPGTYSPEEVDVILTKLEAMRSTMNRAARKAKGLIDATREQRQKVKDMKAANLAKPDAYTEDEIKVETTKLRELMCKYSKRSLIPVSEMREQAAQGHRAKIKEMKAANRECKDTYTQEQIARKLHENHMCACRAINAATTTMAANAVCSIRSIICRGSLQ